MENQEIIQKIKEITAEFLLQMGLDAEVKAEFKEEEADAGPTYLKLDLEGDNLGELVGYHGKNLEAMQVILGLMLSREIDSKDVRIIADINGYREKRKKHLESSALRAAEQVRTSGQPLEMPPMKPYERRVVHMVLKEEEGIRTESTGEGRDRRIVIYKEELF